MDQSVQTNGSTFDASICQSRHPGNGIVGIVVVPEEVTKSFYSVQYLSSFGVFGLGGIFGLLFIGYLDIFETLGDGFQGSIFLLILLLI